MQNAIRCADISHPTKTSSVHKKWTNLINEEFFAQGRREKQLGLPISPLCDESNFHLAKSQQGFITFLAKPTFAHFANVADGALWIANLEKNLEMWRAMETSEK